MKIDKLVVAICGTIIVAIASIFAILIINTLPHSDNPQVQNITQNAEDALSILIRSPEILVLIISIIIGVFLAYKYKKSKEDNFL